MKSSSQSEPPPNLPPEATSSTLETQTTITVAAQVPEETAEKPFTFTMMDVYQELEELKNQVSSAGSSNSAQERLPPVILNIKHHSRPKSAKASKNGKSGLENHISSLNPWSYFNRDVSFIQHNRKMRALSDEEVIELARDEIGKRILYHKERCENNGKRMHVHFKNNLNELKSKIDRSKAVVIIYILQNRKPDDIERLERKLFPFTTRVLLSMD